MELMSKSYLHQLPSLCFLMVGVMVFMVIILSLFEYHYGLSLTRTLTSLTTQTDLSRPDGWSPYCIPFETLMPKGITRYMSDRGYSLNFYSS